LHRIYKMKMILIKLDAFYLSIESNNPGEPAPPSPAAPPDPPGK